MSDRIVELLDLARGKNADARAKLVENITDLFLSDDGRLSEHERALMNDILTKLISQVEANIRGELADALARSGIDLPDVANMLASDEIEIARPLLEKSPLLKDPELIEIIRMRTEEHRIAIATRENLSADVSNAIIEYGSDDAIETLLSNNDASISKHAMEYLVAESRRVDKFQEPLVQRNDLPPDLAYRMFWWVSAALRKRIMSDFDVDPLQLEVAIRNAAQAAIIDNDKQDSAYARAQKLVRRMRESGDLTVAFLMTSLRQRKIAIFVAGLAELGSVTFKTAWQIFSDKGGESFAILSKAIGIDRTQFTSLYLLVIQARDGDSPKSPGVVNKTVKLFDRISSTAAKGALLVWQRENAYQTAIEELEAK